MQQFRVEPPLEVIVAAPCQRVCDAINYIFDDPSVAPTWVEIGNTKWATVARVPLGFQVKLVETGEIVILDAKGDFTFELTDKGRSTDMIIRLRAECEVPDWADDQVILELLGLMSELVAENIVDDALGMEESDGPEVA